MKKALIAGIAVSVLGAGMPFSSAVASARVAPASSASAGTAATPHTGKLTLVIGSGWTDSERALLKRWTASGSPELTVLAQVVGPPGHDETVTVSKDPSLGGLHAELGDYSVSAHRIVLESLRLHAFMHALNHAVHDTWMLSDSVWEEGLAHAAEIVEVDRLAAEGVPEAQYQDLHHSGIFDQYYENTNVPAIAVGTGPMFDGGVTALELPRYVEAGYAFGKILFRNPHFIARFNALLFQHPDGDLAPATLEAMAGSIAPWVEARRFPVWIRRQHILDPAPPTGCRLFQQVAIYQTVVYYCRSSTGVETPQAGATVFFDAFGADGQPLAHKSAETDEDGSVRFGDESSYSGYGRLRFVASVRAPGGSVLVQSTAVRQIQQSDDGDPGLFGVVRNASSGVITFSSPAGRFPSFAVPVTGGAFAATRLADFAGRIIASFTGDGKTATRLFVKDASPYSVVLLARAPA